MISDSEQAQIDAEAKFHSLDGDDRHPVERVLDEEVERVRIEHALDQMGKTGPHPGESTTPTGDDMIVVQMSRNQAAYIVVALMEFAKGQPLAHQMDASRLALGINDHLQGE